MSLLVDVLQYGTGSHTTASEAGNFFATDFIADGVVGAVGNTSGVAPMTGGFAVNAQGTPDMTVAVTAGVAYLAATPASQNSQRLRVRLTTTTNVTITSNTSGSTRYDHVYIKVDPTNAANPNAAADNVATLVTSRSTNAVTDDGTPPTYGYKLGVVTVANGASTITNGNIADKRAQTGANALDTGTSWTSWTPTLTNLTVGSGGTVVAAYQRIGKTIRFRFRFTLGTGSAVGSQPTFTLPVATASVYNDSDEIGRGSLVDFGAAAYPALATWNSSTTLKVRCALASGSYTQQADVTATVPFTYGTGDFIFVQGEYEAA